MSSVSESSQPKRRRSKRLKEENFPISAFGRCVVICANGVKPAQWLAERAACTERNANLIISGQQKPNARAIHALNGAFFD